MLVDPLIYVDDSRLRDICDITGLKIERLSFPTRQGFPEIEPRISTVRPFMFLPITAFRTSAVSFLNPSAFIMASSAVISPGGSTRPGLFTSPPTYTRRSQIPLRQGRSAFLRQLRKPGYNAGRRILKVSCITSLQLSRHGNFIFEKQRLIAHRTA